MYASIIYLFFTYNKQTPSVHFNNNIIYSTIFIIVFCTKFLGVIPLILDDLIRFIRASLSLFNESMHLQDIKRLDFLKKTNSLDFFV